MTTTVLVVIIIALLVSVLIIFAVLMWYLNNREERQIKSTPHYRHDVIVSGGVDIITGQMTHNDHQYFNGMNQTHLDTVCIGASGAMNRHNNIYKVTLIDQNRGVQHTCRFDKEVVIGRDPSKVGKTGLVLQDTSVSSVHCRVYRGNGIFYIQDLGSSNHTYVNGTMITTAIQICNGDILRIGKSQFKIILQ